MTALSTLRLYATLEGCSYLLLLFVAVPLKHLFGFPVAVRVAGGVHGLFFLLFLSALARVATEDSWPTRRVLRVFIAALLPGGAFALRAAFRQETRATPKAATDEPCPVTIKNRRT